MSKIGIPRSLAYFIYFPFWKTFFEELNQEVIVSSPTTRDILDDGVREAVNACNFWLLLAAISATLAISALPSIRDLAKSDAAW